MLTDNEIIKALECCRDGDCKNCTFDECTTGLLDKGIALALINRQKAEIERLEHSAKQWEDTAKDLFVSRENIKADAIKEFAERLKDTFDRYGAAYDCYAIIDKLVKEMVGATKC